MRRVEKYGGAIERAGRQGRGNRRGLWRRRSLRWRGRCLREAEVCRDGQEGGYRRFLSKIQGYKWLSSVRGQWV